MSRSNVLVALSLTVTAACAAAPPSVTLDDGAQPDDAALDAAVVPVTPPSACPTSGKGAVVTSASCVVFPPTATGADPAGENATVSQYALAPGAPASGRLVVFLNPSIGSPATSIGDPVTNIYTAAIAARDHALAVAYPSDQVIGRLCNGDDACFLATRTAIVTGVRSAEVPAELRPIGPTDTIHARIALALSYLASAQPGAGWAQYLVRGVDPRLDPAGAVQWSRVIVMGHSQGGGHAALLARLHPVARLVTLSSPCDEVSGAAASWLHADGSWQAQPAVVGYGFATRTTFTGTTPTGGDTTCPAHAAVWDALGLPAEHRFEDAAGCAGASAHTATTQCPANMARVQSLLTP